MRVCIALPVLNEQHVLQQSVQAITNELRQYPNVDWTVVIADNGSTDQTGAIARGMGRNFSECALEYQYIATSGKGRAIRRAWNTCNADWYVFMDIDLAVDLSALSAMVAHMENHSADILIGSRYIPGAHVTRTVLRSLLSESYNILCRRMIGLQVTDAQCGFKAVRSDVARDLLPLVKDDQWFFDTELLWLAQQRKKTILEIPVDWVETRSRGRKSKVKLFKTIVDYLWKMRELRKRGNKDQGTGGKDGDVKTIDKI